MTTDNETPAAPAVNEQPAAAPINDAGLAADLERLAAEAATDATPPAVAAMRENQAQAAALEQQETAAALALLLEPAFGLLAPGWNVQAGECQALAGAWSPVLVKYFPGGIGQMGPELTALLVTAAVIGPRLGKPRTVDKQDDGKAAA